MHPGQRNGAQSGRCYHPSAMLDHEEQFLFKEEIIHLPSAPAEAGALDNVEDLLAVDRVAQATSLRGLYP